LAHAISDGYLFVVNVHNDTVIAVDVDGSAGPESAVLLTTLQGATVLDTDTASFQVT
jgi:hypothetical protein